MLLGSATAHALARAAYKVSVPMWSGGDRPTARGAVTVTGVWVVDLLCLLVIVLCAGLRYRAGAAVWRWPAHCSAARSATGGPVAPQVGVADRTAQHAARRCGDRAGGLAGAAQPVGVGGVPQQRTSDRWDGAGYRVRGRSVRDRIRRPHRAAGRVPVPLAVVRVRRARSEGTRRLGGTLPTVARGAGGRGAHRRHRQPVRLVRGCGTVQLRADRLLPGTSDRARGGVQDGGADQHGRLRGLRGRRAALHQHRCAELRTVAQHAHRFVAPAGAGRFHAAARRLRHQDRPGAVPRCSCARVPSCTPCWRTNKRCCGWPDSPR